LDHEVLTFGVLPDLTAPTRGAISRDIFMTGYRDFTSTFAGIAEFPIAFGMKIDPIHDIVNVIS
jgi:hypothetical protein